MLLLWIFTVVVDVAPSPCLPIISFWQGEESPIALPESAAQPAMLQFGKMPLAIVLVSGFVRRSLAFRFNPASLLGSRQRLSHQKSGAMAAPFSSLFSTLPDDETTTTADSDEEEEIGSGGVILNGNEPIPNHRYKELLDSVGLDGLSGVAELPDPRVVTDNDLFCNRELKMAGITAIGFDMDYTLA